MAVLPTGIGPVTGGYQIERSLRFNSADSAYLSRTPASAGNRKTFTISFWIKRGNLSSRQFIFGNTNSSATGGIYCGFQESTGVGGNGDRFMFAEYGASSYTYNIHTTQLFRDISAWYHIVVSVDTTQATASNRIKLYVNGSQVTAFSEATYPTLNLDTAWNTTQAIGIGRLGSYTSLYANAYLTEFYNVDGQALTPSSFGETDAQTGVWVPKAYTSTYGTNGFFLKFADNSGTTSTTLGKDSSGNGNNFTPNNLSVTAGSGNDSLVDTPTSYGSDTGAGGEVRGNYATLNPLITTTTLSNGNLQSVSTASPFGRAHSTIGVSSGKWYAEVTVTTVGSGPVIGITNAPVASNATGGLGYLSTEWSYYVDGRKYNSNSLASYGSSYTTNDVIGVALDLDNKTISFYKNGTSQGTAYSSLPDGTYFISYSGTNTSATTVNFNFGQRPFAYTAPSGFKALCTQNLPTPTIGATSTTQANKYFNAVLWTGDGSSSRSITGVGFQPDFVWTKARSGASNLSHTLYDALRGATKYLNTDQTAAEGTLSTGVTSFDSDGFSIGSWPNQNTQTQVAWNWNAGGSNATNTSGTITSTVRANTTSGFSIVTYTGNGSASATFGHGLGVAPKMVIVKSRSSGTTGWAVWHTSIPATDYLVLNTTAAKATAATLWNSTAPTSTLVNLGDNAWVNLNTGTFVAYCFAEVAGYSAFGSYTGNGSTDGPFIFTNFRPRFVFWKNASTTGDWQMKDAARSTYNVTNANLYANLSNAENSAGDVDFLSNGFKIRSSGTDVNGSGNTIIYAAFAETPAKFSLAR